MTVILYEDIFQAFNRLTRKEDDPVPPLASTMSMEVESHLAYLIARDGIPTKMVRDYIKILGSTGSKRTTFQTVKAFIEDIRAYIINQGQPAVPMSQPRDIVKSDYDELVQHVVDIVVNLDNRIGHEYAVAQYDRHFGKGAYDADHSTQVRSESKLTEKCDAIYYRALALFQMRLMADVSVQLSGIYTFKSPDGK